MERCLWSLLIFCIIANVISSEKIKVNNKLGPNVKKYIAFLEKALSSLKNDELMEEHRKFVQILNKKIDNNGNKKEEEEEESNDDDETSTKKISTFVTPLSVGVSHPTVPGSTQNSPQSTQNQAQSTQNTPKSTQNQAQSTKVSESQESTADQFSFTTPTYVARVAHKFHFSTVAAKTDEKIRITPPFVIAPLRSLPPSVPSIILPKIPTVIRSKELNLFGSLFPELGSHIDEDDMSYEYEEYEDEDENFVVQFKDDEKFTTPAICIEDSCPSFNCSATDDKTFFAMKSIVPLSANDVREACGKSYLFSHVEQTYDKAGLSCCRENMNLLSIESPEEMKCLLDLYKDELKKGSSFWSSGRYLTCPNQYRWCGSWRRFTGGATWTKSDKDKGGECVSLKFATDKISFEDDRCGNRRKYICESETTEEEDFKLTAKPLCTTATCPELDCVVPPNPTLPAGIQQACGKKYYFSGKMSQYVRAAKECCNLGMKLVSVHSKEEQECLYNLYSERINKNRQVWTSGTDLGCEGNYLWCGSNTMYNTSAKHTWIPGEPNNLYKREHCLTLVHQDETFKLNDEYCEENFPYICQA